MKKWLAFGIILLFICVTVVPSINMFVVKASNDNYQIQYQGISTSDPVIWNNYGYIPSSYGWASQWDDMYPFQCQVADDFFLENNSLVTSVHWWGWFGGDLPCPNPIDFNIIFYHDDETGTMPTGTGMEDPTPTAISVYHIPQVNGDPVDPYNPFNMLFEYNTTLPTPFYAEANTKYWIAIQGNLSYPPQCGWLTNGDNPDQLLGPVQGFPLVGTPYWTDISQGGDMAFVLNGIVNPCPSPPVIHGPTEGFVNVEYDFSVGPITDPSGGSLYCRWNWGDGNITEWLGPYPSGSTIYASHSWDDDGVFDIHAKLKESGSESNWSEPHTITIVQNQQPSTPIITGPSQGKRGISYNYDIESLDPENENISYYIDWADGTNTGWIGPFPSGQEQILNHTWNKKGIYTIKAKARDIHDQESDWGTLTVTMPYEPPQFPFIQWLLERFPNAFPILRFLLEFNH